MGYWLLRTYGLWYANPRPPSWWTKKYMGFRGLWVIKVMGYEGVNCISIGPITESICVSPIAAYWH
jgi:hypothetical protein